MHSKFIIKWKSSSKFWLFSSVFFSILILIPLSSIFLSLFNTPIQDWANTFNNNILIYIKNTIILSVGVSFFSALFAILPAWFIANYKFPFSKQIKWLLVLPLSIPTYIIAFVYGDIFSFGGEFYSFFNLIFGLTLKDIYFDIFKIYYLIPIISSVLYPYLYLTCLDSFENNNRAFIESAELMGKSKLFVFLKIALPLSRPAIASGLFLINMELLNDYGAMDYFGVQTFTTGIFRSWFGLNDLSTAMRLALILFTIVFLFIQLEKLFRRKSKYYEDDNFTRLSKNNISKAKSISILIFCLFPIFVGFIIPIAKLTFNTLTIYNSINLANYSEAILNTGFLALGSSVIIVIVSISLIYGERTGKFSSMRKLISLSTIGYAIPGAIIAVSMLFFLSFLKVNYEIFLFGTILVLIYSYNIRFMTTGYSSIKSATDKLGNNSYESSKLMGFGSIKSFWRVERPILKPAIMTALLVSFVEILKELPLTLILRPFNFETLSTIAYQYAKNEMMKDASIYSLTIVAISIIPIIFFVNSKREL